MKRIGLQEFCESTQSHLFAAVFASVTGSMISPGRASANEICFEGETYQLGESRVFMGRDQDDPYLNFGGVPFDEYLGVSDQSGALDFAATDLKVEDWFSENAMATWGSEDTAQAFAIFLAAEYPSQYNFKKIPCSHDGGDGGQLNWWTPNGLDAVAGLTKNYRGESYVTSVKGDECTPELDVPPIDTQKSEYTIQELAEGKVEPRFEGGTLSFAEGNTSTDKDFEVEKYDINAIDNAGKSFELSGVLSGPGGMIYKGEGVTYAPFWQGCLNR